MTGSIVTLWPWLTSFGSRRALLLLVCLQTTSSINHSSFWKKSVCYSFFGTACTYNITVLQYNNVGPTLLYCNTAGSPCFSITLVHTGVLGSATPDQDSRILATSSEFCSCLNKRSDNTSDVTCAERWIIGFEDGILFSPKVQLNELAKILRWIKEEQTWKDSWQFVVAVVMAWSCSTLFRGDEALIGLLPCYWR